MPIWSSGALHELGRGIRSGGRPSSNDVRQIARHYWRDCQPLLDELFDEVGDAAEPLRDALPAGGGHLRAMLPPLIALLDGTGDEGAVAAAAWAGLGCELVHVGTLVHDDILDEAPSRRRTDALWSTAGVGMTVAVGDLAIALGQHALSRSGLDSAGRGTLHAALAAAVAHLQAGQVEEIQLRAGNQLPTREWCHRTTRAKTGALLGCALGAGVMHCDGGSIPATVMEAGEELGVCFQIVDDLRDAMSDAASGAHGEDLWEGKPSWLVACAAESLPRDRCDSLATALYRRRDAKTSDDVAHAARLLDDGRAGEQTLDELSASRHRLLAGVDHLPAAVASAIALVLTTIDARTPSPPIHLS
ncbi:MAG: polyprenyl synthetase family protein [Actinomycetota bacterium]